MQKRTSHIRIKKALFTILLGLLFLPMIQQRFKFYSSKELGGYHEQIESPYFSKQEWISGEYQAKREAYVKSNFGFRPELYRLYNQYHYSFYKVAKANGVVVGKENYLYELNYIKAHLGRDFIGTDKIQDQVYKLSKINDTLIKLNTRLVVLLAPGKGSYYPEYIPDRFAPKYRTITNYEVYSKCFEKSEIAVLDAKQWFQKMRYASKYPLFPKTGVHWSKYSEMLVADSLIKFIENLTKTDLVTLQLIRQVESEVANDWDGDIEHGMNLLFNIEDLTMAYPEYTYTQKKNSRPLDVLTIADSYYWGLYNDSMSTSVFNNGKFWYYFEQIYPESATNQLLVTDIDIKEEIEKQDVILILCTDANLNRFGFGFIDRVYDLYYK